MFNKGQSGRVGLISRCLKTSTWCSGWVSFSSILGKQSQIKEIIETFASSTDMDLLNPLLISNRQSVVVIKTSHMPMFDNLTEVVTTLFIYLTSNIETVIANNSLG